MYYLLFLLFCTYFKNVGIPRFELKYIGFYNASYKSPNLSVIINLLLGVIVMHYTFLLKYDCRIDGLDYVNFYCCY